MVQPDRAAVEEIVAHIDHLAGQRCTHRRSGGGGNVHAAVRIARLAVEDTAQAEAAGATARHRHAHVQAAGRLRLGEGGHHGLQVGGLAFVAGIVFGRQIHRLGRDLKALLHILFVAHRIAHGAQTAVGLHANALLTRCGGQRYAHECGPFDHVAHHQNLGLRCRDQGACGGRAQRQACDAAGNPAVLRPERAVRVGAACRPGRCCGKQRCLRHPLQQATACGRERGAGKLFGRHGAFRIVQALCCIAIDSGAKGDTGM